MGFPTVTLVLRQLFSRPATNPYPVVYAPDDVTAAVRAIEAGKIVPNPPVAVPDRFRGKISYDRERCIGCQLCVKSCPSRTIEFLSESRKVRFFIARCTFCSQCVEVCPVNAIAMTDEFTLATFEKYGDSLVVDGLEGATFQIEKRDEERRKSGGRKVKARPKTAKSRRR